MRVQRLTFGGAAVSLGATKEHVRIDFSDDDAAIEGMIATATRELEDFAQISILNASIRVDLDGWPNYGQLALPIAPVMADADLDVSADGAPVTGVELVPGTRPALILPDDMVASLACAKVRIDYTAGWGATTGSTPSDIAHAIMDQVAALYDERGAVDHRRSSLSPHMARIGARYRRVRI